MDKPNSINFDTLEKLIRLSEEYCRSDGKQGIPDWRFSDTEIEAWVVLNKHFRHGMRAGSE